MLLCELLCNWGQKAWCAIHEALFDLSRLKEAAFVAAILLPISTTILAVSSPPAFIPIGTSRDCSASSARAISSDGQTVVGECYGQAFRWTSDEGLVSLGVLPGATGSIAEAVSSDGSAVVGQSDNRAFRYTASTGMQDLGLFPGGTASRAFGVSGDGTIVVGDADSNSSELMGFKWTSREGLIGIGSMPPNPPNTSAAYGISSNGVVVVGCTDPNGDYQRAIRWTDGAGMQSIYSPPGPGVIAKATSSNGAVIVGGGPAFRWTSSTGAQTIPAMQLAFSVSADGSIVVGRDIPLSDHVAKVWTQTCGTRVLRDLLLQAGVSQVEGWQLNIAYDIADDNRTIVGLGTNPQGQEQGFLARLPRKGDINFDGLVNVADLLKLINSWGPCAPGTCPFSDVNCDGTLNQIDLVAILDNWES